MKTVSAKRPRPMPGPLPPFSSTLRFIINGFAAACHKMQASIELHFFG